MHRSYLSTKEIIQIITFEASDLKDKFESLSKEHQEYSAMKVTNLIESLGIINRSKKEGELTFPLLYQEELTLNFKICFSLETLYIALNIESEEIKLAKMGILNESDTTASISYNKTYLSRLRSCPFRNLKAYELIKIFIPKSFNMR